MSEYLLNSRKKEGNKEGKIIAHALVMSEHVSRLRARSRQYVPMSVRVVKREKYVGTTFDILKNDEFQKLMDQEYKKKRLMYTNKPKYSGYLFHRLLFLQVFLDLKI